MAKSENETEHIYTDLYKFYNDDMKGKAVRFVYPVDLTEQVNDIKSIVEKMKVSKAEAIRVAVKHYAEYVHGLEVITYRKVGKAQAKKEIQQYLKGKERVWADEISSALRINFDIVNEVLLELWEAGWVEPSRKS